MIGLICRCWIVLGSLLFLSSINRWRLFGGVLYVESENFGESLIVRGRFMMLMG